MAKQLNFLIADDHELILNGMESLLAKTFVNSKITKVKSAEEALEKAGIQLFDFMITDISMEGMDGVDLCKTIKSKYPTTKIIVVTQHKKIWIIKKLYSLKVNGLILKEDSMEELVMAVKSIQKGTNYYTRSINDIILSYMINRTQTELQQIELTGREQEIIELIAQEYTTKEISEKLFLSHKTIETHRKNLLLKFEVRNMVGLVKKAMELGFLD